MPLELSLHLEKKHRVYSWLSLKVRRKLRVGIDKPCFTSLYMYIESFARNCHAFGMPCSHRAERSLPRSV